ncbi:MAG TPA: gliding motility-associated C-terminal domain-containing protein, partial [Flavobacterium sp.]
NASGTASFVSNYTVTSVIALVSVATTGGCTQTLTNSITISVRTPATVTLSPSATVCSGATGSVTFTGTPNATVTYTVNGGANQTIVLNASGTATLTGTYTATTTYTLVSAALSGNPSCPQSQTGSTTITVATPPTASLSANQSICPGQNATVTFTGTPNAIVTYNINGGADQTITLSASGTATITGIYNTTTTYNLVNVVSGGASGCTQPLTGAVVITVIPAPIATISPNQNVCIGSSADVTITGTPNSTVTYTVNGGTNQTILLDASGQGIITGTYSANTTFTLVSVQTAGTPACTQTLNAASTILVAPLPIASLSADQNTCAGEQATVTFTGTANAVVSYTVNGGPVQTITLGASGTASITQTYSATTTYALISVSTGCSQPQTDTMTVNVSPAPTATIAADATICSGGPATVSITGPPNATVTYNINGGASQTILLDAAGIATITNTYTTSTTINLTSITAFGTPACIAPLSASVTITVLPLPTATIAVTGNATICSGDNATITFTGTPNAIVTYTVNGGTQQTILLDASGTSVITTAYSANATYDLVSVALSSPACSQPVTGTAVITVSPAPNAGTDAAPVTFCASSGSQDLFLLLGPSAQTGGTWSPTLASGTGIFDPNIDAAGTYTYTVAGNGTCPADSATVTVLLNPVPNAGTDATIQYCSNEGIQDLFLLLGPNAQTGGTWTPALSSGTGMFDPAIDAAGVYTYSLGGVAPCPSDSSTVTVSVSQAVNAGTNGTVTLCANSASVDLLAYLGGTPQSGGTWSPVLASATSIFNPAVDAAGVYTYTITGTAPCLNSTATVAVTVNPIPDAGTDGTVAFCSNDAPADLILSLGGTPQSGGTWSPALASGTGVFDPTVDMPGIYTYTVGGNLCTTNTASATVTVTPLPDAGIDGTINTCAAVTSIDLMTGLTGTPGTGTWSDDNSTGALTGNIFDPSVAGVGTYTFTYTVGGGSSACPADTSVVTVVVDQSVSAGTFAGLQSFCNSAATLDLFDLISGAQAGGTWTDSNGVAVTNPIALSTLATGSQSYAYTVTGTCGTDSETVQFNLLQSPVLTTANFTVASVCSGSGTTVNFTGMTDGDYTVTYTLSGANTGSETVILAIAGGTGSITINASDLPNTGTTILTFGTILNNDNSCGAVLTNVSASFSVNPLPDLTDANLTIPNVCFGSSVVVNIASTLSDGNYQFNYTIPQLSPGTGSTGTITLTGGAGQFTIPASMFTTAGSYSIVINNIINPSTGCDNLSENATANFTIDPVANIAGASMAAPAICLGQPNIVTITGATNIADGNYTVSYQLSGASTALGSVTVAIASGSGTFIIPASEIATAGAVTVTVNQFQAASGTCAASGTIAPLSFNVEQAQTPVLITDGDQFCGTDNPTVAELSSNITGTEAVTWYDAPIAGNVVAPTTLLQNGVTYYASYNTAAGCETSIRLAVTVDLTVCEVEDEDILIPDGFSPNGDGINDEFEIVDLAVTYPKFHLEIYNRYGNVLYKGTKDTPNWNGTSGEGGVNIGGAVVPTGVYFYVLEFNDGVRKPVQGRVYLSR